MRFGRHRGDDDQALERERPPRARRAAPAARAERRAARKARRAGRWRATGAPGPGSLRIPRLAALVAIAVIIAAASLTSFAESYRGLFDWAREHGLSGVWAACWPLQVDVFIATGELALFVALADSWPVRSRVAAWGVALLGLAASVLGNIGHVHSHLLTDRATAAVPPLAAAAALAVGLGVLKRVVQAHHQNAPGTGQECAPRVQPSGAPALNGQAHPERTPAVPPKRARTRSRTRARNAPVTAEDAEREFMAELASGTLPSLRQICSRLHVGQPRARQLREHLEALGHAAAGVA